jgi:hypothetical protein
VRNDSEAATARRGAAVYAGFELELGGAERWPSARPNGEAIPELFADFLLNHRPADAATMPDRLVKS